VCFSSCRARGALGLVCSAAVPAAWRQHTHPCYLVLKLLAVYALPASPCARRVAALAVKGSAVSGPASTQHRRLHHTRLYHKVFDNAVEPAAVRRLVRAEERQTKRSRRAQRTLFRCSSPAATAARAKRAELRHSCAVARLKRTPPRSFGTSLARGSHTACPAATSVRGARTKKGQNEEGSERRTRQ
jgi:hypothetical protein